MDLCGFKNSLVYRVPEQPELHYVERLCLKTKHKIKKPKVESKKKEFMRWVGSIHFYEVVKE